MKNILEGINRRSDDAEEWINKLEDMAMESNKAEQQKGKKVLNEELRDLYDNFKRNNIHIIGVPEGEERKK